MTLNSYKFIKSFLAFSPRQGKNETRAGKFLTDLLRQNQIKFTLQKFNCQIPKVIKAELTVDDKTIPCEAITFASGIITDKKNLISNQLEAEKNFPYISFNPTGKAICASGRCINYPALAISQTDLPKILNAKNIKGIVKVKSVDHQSQNILVGNLVNPQNLIFAHYDSINLGATDNASGIAVTMKLILERQKLLANNLFILCGNEELAYDFPIYWGYGYRVFEKKYLGLFKKAKKIFVLDCVGNGKTQLLTDPLWIKEGFPVKIIKHLLKKTMIVCGDIDKLMTVYHSQSDNLSQLKPQYLENAYRKILSKLR